MTATQYNYNRRNSNTTPYTIPVKVQQQQHANHPHHAHQHHHHHHPGNALSPTSSYINSPPLSSSVPTLSREFVVRRISEGETGRLKEELRCEACGKGYKHISSLAKHLWEHTPEWNVTKKLLISKHQQVQLLEAASILVGMNEPGTVTSGHHQPPRSASHSHSNSQTHAHQNYSDESPFSPVNSADTNHTTPTPPADENASVVLPPSFKNTFDNNSDIEHHQQEDAKSGKYNRMNSISQYPPSLPNSNNHALPPSSPAMLGGYLDNNKYVTKTTPSASIPSTATNDELKSPSPSYKAVPSSISKSPILANFTRLDEVVKTKVVDEDDIDDIEVNQSFQDDEEVVGKLEA
ncbi:C2H2 zinc finger domain-containing protein [Scheffersomyces amazonensis]|uniref:C2H2 zinc finger domain-containing protein n=1 Tax=Scheffersomyces amazonensis TaxID=1078765 RepID=UPI00315D4E6C